MKNILLFVFIHRLSLAMLPVDFDVSMQECNYENVLNMGNFKQLYTTLKNIYNYRSVKVGNETTLRIPKIIHHIWLGSRLPDEYQAYRETWMQLHPDWFFIFWTDTQDNYDKGMVINTFDDLEQYLAQLCVELKSVVVNTQLLSFDNKCFFDASNNFGERSDILKWEIVYRFGGVYIDTDFECLKSLEPLHYLYDFYTGIQPLDTHRVQLGAALYGAYAGHPILKKCVEGIKYNQHIKQIVIKTGPLHFTDCFFQAVSNKTVDIALPASFFYPCSYEQRGQSAQVWQCPESYAVHHWAGSWLKPEGFVRS